jgi:predicted dipeptidase
VKASAFLWLTLLAASDARAAESAPPAPASASAVRQIFHRDYEARLVPLLLEAIRFRTVEGNAAAFAAQKAWLHRVGAELGFKVRDAGPVVEIELAGPKGAPVLGLVIHGDVQVVSEAEWTVPPFAGVAKDGYVWGRGAADDKGPLVQALLALRSLRDSGLPRTYTIRLLVGSDEETGGSDMKVYLERHRAPDLSLVLDSWFPLVVGEKAWNALTVTVDAPFAPRPGPEKPWALVTLEAGIATSIVPSHAVATLRWQSPSLDGFPQAVAALGAARSDGLRLETAIEGRLVTVTAHGRSVHSGGDLKRGRNALVFLARSLAGRLCASGASDLLAFALLAGQDDYGTGLGLTASDPLWGRYAVNVATVKAADGGRLALTINVRRNPPLTGPELRAHLDAEVAAFNAKHGAALVPSGFYDDEPLAIDPGSELVRRLLAAYERATGETAGPVITAGGTYAKRLPRAIAFGMWFPGQHYPGHEADERVSVESLVRGTDVLIEALVDLATAPPVPPPNPGHAKPVGGNGGTAGPTMAATEPRFDTPSFVNARLSSARSSALYAAYSFGAAGVFFGVVQNPRSGYRELIGGVVARLTSGRQGVSFALGWADAPGEEYVQVYAMPSLSAGRWSVAGSFELYEPWRGAGTRQFYVDPLTVLRRLGRRWEVGASYTLSVETGGDPQHRAGPAAQLALGGGSLKAELLFGSSSSDVRLGYQTAF